MSHRETEKLFKAEDIEDMNKRFARIMKIHEDTEKHKGVYDWGIDPDEMR